MTEEYDIQRCEQTIVTMEMFKTQIKQSLKKIKIEVEFLSGMKNVEIKSKEYLQGIEDGANLTILIAQSMIDFASAIIIKEGEKK